MSEEPKFIQIEIGQGALICALDDAGSVWIFNHKTQVWDKLPAGRNEHGATKATHITTLKP